MKVGEVMSTGAATVQADAPLVEAVRIMVQHRISGLPVVDGSGKLVGVVTEGDFMTVGPGKRPRPFELLTEGKIAADQLSARRVEEIMTREPVTVDVEAPLEEAVETMKREKVKRLPVVAEGRIVGILSRSDILAALLRKAQL